MRGLADACVLRAKWCMLAEAEYCRQCRAGTADDAGAAAATLPLADAGAAAAALPWPGPSGLAGGLPPPPLPAPAVVIPALNARPAVPPLTGAEEAGQGRGSPLDTLADLFEIASLRRKHALLEAQARHPAEPAMPPPPPSATAPLQGAGQQAANGHAHSPSTASDDEGSSDCEVRTLLQMRCQGLRPAAPPRPQTVFQASDRPQLIKRCTHMQTDIPPCVQRTKIPPPERRPPAGASQTPRARLLLAALRWRMFRRRTKTRWCVSTSLAHCCRTPSMHAHRLRTCTCATICTCEVLL